MARKQLAVAALVGATSIPLWPALAWAYGNFPTSGGGGGAETIGHNGGANADLPPMGVTNDRPAGGSSETVTESATACLPGSVVTLNLAYVSPGSGVQQFGATGQTVNGSGGFSVTGSIPSGATSGTYVIFASCNDASGNTLVFTATIVVPGSTTGSGVRSSVVGATGGGTTRAASGGASGASSGTGAGTTGSWSAPATWGTPQLRALVDRAVNAAAVSAPVVLSLGSHPVLAHTAGVPGSAVPLRDGLLVLIGGVALTSLTRLNRRHGMRRRTKWNRRRHSSVRRVLGGGKPKGTW